VGFFEDLYGNGTVDYSKATAFSLGASRGPALEPFSAGLELEEEPELPVNFLGPPVAVDDV